MNPRSALLIHVSRALLLSALLASCAVGTRRRPYASRADASAFEGDAALAPSTGRGAGPGEMDAAGGLRRPSTEDGAVVTDAGTRDATAARDAAPRSDAASLDAGRGDGGATDAAVDAAPVVDAGPPEPPLVVPLGSHVYASADYALTTGVNGYDISDRFRVGWRFEVPAGEVWTLDGAGYHNRGGAGSVFGALVALDGPDDLPDSLDLTTPDVLSVATAELAGRGHVVVPLAATLDTGWYAVIFGTDAFGTSASGEHVGPSNGHVPLSDRQAPFTILQTTGATFAQRPGARFVLLVRD